MGGRPPAAPSAGSVGAGSLTGGGARGAGSSTGGGASAAAGAGSATGGGAGSATGAGAAAGAGAGAAAGAAAGAVACAKAPLESVSAHERTKYLDELSMSFPYVNLATPRAPTLSARETPPHAGTTILAPGGRRPGPAGIVPRPASSRQVRRAARTTTRPFGCSVFQAKTGRAPSAQPAATPQKLLLRVLGVTEP